MTKKTKNNAIIAISVLLVVFFFIISITLVNGSTSQKVSVSESSDDVYNISGNRRYITNSPTQYLGKYGSRDFWNGWRWAEITIPQGARIIEANMDIYSAAYSKGNNVEIVFFGDNSGNAKKYNNNEQKPENKLRTASFVTKTFNAKVWSAEQGFGVDKIDVTTIVQEIINRNDWEAGNSIAIMAHDIGSKNNNYIGYSTYDRKNDRGARLEINYEEKAIETDAVNAPINLITKTIDKGKIELSWGDDSTNEIGFTIERSSDGITFYPLDFMGINDNYYIDSGLNSGIGYYYRVMANGEVNNSEYSNISWAVTTSDTWNSSVMAWIYPGKPGCNAINEYSTGRIIHYLKPEYFTIDYNGQLKLLTSGCNAYSAENVESIKNNSSYQFVSVSSGPSNMAILVSSYEKKVKVIDDLIDFVLENDFEGVEIDFEGYGAWSILNYIDYKSFITELGDALHNVDKKLMVDGPPISNEREQRYYTWKYEDFVSLPVDYTVVLAYDYMYDWGAGTAVADNKWVLNIVEWTKTKSNGLDKIVIGIPAYGYHGLTGGYQISIDTKEESSKYPGFESAVRQKNSFEMMWENKGITYVYQDSESLNKKRELLESVGVKYISVFHLGGNDWFDARSEFNVEN